MIVVHFVGRCADDRTELCRASQIGAAGPVPVVNSIVLAVD
jgi:hypothetical protein